MGQVYLAKQIDAEREVALKMLRITIQDEDSKARFFREFKVLSELKHPHIMTVYGLSLDANSNPYAICEYLEGTSLRGHLGDGPLAWQQAVKIAIEIADALQAAHQQGIIHRDLKPENIMLVDKPHPDFVKLIDFGLSRIVEEGSQKLTSTGQMIGSPLYMSPEQSRQAADHRSDIYSLACILFEMLSGQHLFPADEAIAAMYLHSNESATNRFISISQLVPEKLIDLLAEMLAKNPDDRCQSAAEVRDRLKRIHSEPGRLMSQKGQTKKVSQSQIIIAASLMIAAVGLTLFLANGLSSVKHDPAKLEVAPKSFEKQIADIDKEFSQFHMDLMEANVEPIPREVVRRRTEAFIERLKALESRAKSNKDKYRVYTLEAACYAKLDDLPNRFRTQQLALREVRARKHHQYGEEVSALSSLASIAQQMGESELAKKLSIETIQLRSKYTRLAEQGQSIPNLLPETFRIGGGWSGLGAVDTILTEIYLAEKNYTEAAKYSKPIYESELESFPQKAPGNASMTGTLNYATCLIKLGRREQAREVVESVLSVLNKPGDIPQTRRPNGQRATAADILNLYGNATGWLEQNGFPAVATRYRKQAAEYAKSCQLENFWSKHPQ